MNGQRRHALRVALVLLGLAGADAAILVDQYVVAAVLGVGAFARGASLIGWWRVDDRHGAGRDLGALPEWLLPVGVGACVFGALVGGYIAVTTHHPDVLGPVVVLPAALLGYVRKFGMRRG